MYDVSIYTDGACSGNPGAGGWAAILICNSTTKEISGAEKETTNNRMELMAVIEALSCIKYESKITVYSDSAYVVNALTQGWLENWKKSNWRTSGKKEVLNRDLWKRLNVLLEKHNVTFQKVKGHADNAYNNRCDTLAREAIKTL